MASYREIAEGRLDRLAGLLEEQDAGTQPSGNSNSNGDDATSSDTEGETR